MNPERRSLMLLSAVASTLAASVPVVGMAAQPAANAGIEEVLVTARRREESLQEIPLSIAAIGSEELTERNVSDLRNVNGQVPNVTIATGQFNGASGGQFRMRGLPGVVVYLDGAPIGPGALPNLTDIERVEVLRGPQGTLFGQSATGGAIQIVTRRPSDTFAADVRTTFGSNSRLDVSANVNVPITDTIFLKASGSSLQRDGYVRSTRVNTEFGSQDDKVARLDLLWRPIESFEGRVQYTRIESASTGHPYVNVGLVSACTDAQAPPIWFNAAGQQTTFAPNAYCLLTTVDTDPSTPGVQPWTTEFHSWGSEEKYLNTIDVADTRWWQKYDDVRLELSYDILDTLTIRSISARRWGSSNSFEDLDATGLDLSVNNLNSFTESADARSTELQLLYSGSRLTGTTGYFWGETDPGFGKRVNWVNNEILQVEEQFPGFIAAANALYPNSATPVSQGGSRVSGPNQLGNQFGLAKNVVTQEAFFTEWTLSVTDNLRLTAGVRYTEEETENTRYLPSQTVNLLPPIWTDVDPGVDYFAVTGPSIVTTSPPYEVWTPRFSVQYQWTPDVMTYLTYSKGSTNVGNLQTPPAFTGIAPFFALGESIKNYEFGLRSELLNGRLRLNGTVFFNDFKNARVTEAWFPGVQITSNADAEVKGVELEGVFRVTDSLTLNYGLGWINAEYTDRGVTQNLQPGAPFPLTPERAFALGLSHTMGFGNGMLTARADYNWQDEMTTVVDRVNSLTLPDVGLLSARLTYRPAAGNWDVALLGTNLTDEFRVMSSFTQPQLTSVGAFVDRPREFGVSFNVRFE